MVRGKWMTAGGFAVLFAASFAAGATAQTRAATSWAFGPAIYVGPVYGPGGYYFGPHPGVYLGHYDGFYGNGFSMYGPPVPTAGPIPGYFGGSNQRLGGSVTPPARPGDGTGRRKWFRGR